MFLLTLLTTIAGVLTGYCGGARLLMASSAAVLVVSLLVLRPAHGWLVLFGLTGLNIVAFEVTAVCMMVYFKGPASRQGHTQSPAPGQPCGARSIADRGSPAAKL